MSTRVTRSSVKRHAEELTLGNVKSTKIENTKKSTKAYTVSSAESPRTHQRIVVKRTKLVDNVESRKKPSKQTKGDPVGLESLPKVRKLEAPSIASNGVSDSVRNKTVVSSSVPQTLPAALVPKGTSRDTLLAEACAHFIAVDPRFEALIQKYPCALYSPEGLKEIMDPFTALASSIISQQISGAAAATIQKRFIALVHATTSPSDLTGVESEPPAELPFPTPAQVATIDIPTLRQAGLSQRKAEFVQGLASKFVSGELSTEMLASADYEQVLEKLIAVRGLGQWSVEMFACFGLKRIDVFSTGDLSVQKAMAIFQGKDVSKLKTKNGKWKYMSEQEMLDFSAKFAPYRSLFMWYMWRVLLE